MSVAAHAVSAVAPLPALAVAPATVHPVEHDVNTPPPAARLSVPAPPPAPPAVEVVPAQVDAAPPAAGAPGAAPGAADLGVPVAGYARARVVAVQESPEGRR